MYRERRQKETEALGRMLLSGVPFDQRKLDTRRGFWLGVQAILDTPEAAWKALEAELREETPLV